MKNLINIIVLSLLINTCNVFAMQKTMQLQSSEDGSSDCIIKIIKSNQL